MTVRSPWAGGVLVLEFVEEGVTQAEGLAVDHALDLLGALGEQHPTGLRVRSTALRTKPPTGVGSGAGVVEPREGERHAALQAWEALGVGGAARRADLGVAIATPSHCAGRAGGWAFAEGWFGMHASVMGGDFGRWLNWSGSSAGRPVVIICQPIETKGTGTKKKESRSASAS